MSDTTLVLLIQAVLLIGGSFFAYHAGRLKEKNDDQNQKSKACEKARKARASLSDPAVVERLHNTYDRKLL